MQAALPFEVFLQRLPLYLIAADLNKRAGHLQLCQLHYWSNTTNVTDLLDLSASASCQTSWVCVRPNLMALFLKRFWQVTASWPFPVSQNSKPVTKHFTYPNPLLGVSKKKKKKHYHFADEAWMTQAKQSWMKTSAAQLRTSFRNYSVAHQRLTLTQNSWHIHWQS